MLCASDTRAEPDQMYSIGTRMCCGQMALGGEVSGFRVPGPWQMLQSRCVLLRSYVMPELAPWGSASASLGVQV